MKKNLKGVILLCLASCSGRIPSIEMIQNISGKVDKTVTELKVHYAPKKTVRVITGRIKDVSYIYMEEYPRDNDGGLGVEKTPRLIDLSKVSGGEQIKLNNGWYLKDLQTSKKGLVFTNLKIMGSIIEDQSCEIILVQENPQIECDKK